VLVSDALARGELCLSPRPGLPDPRREAVWLLAHAWGIAETRVMLELDHPVPPAVEQRFTEWLQRRAEGEPAHHLLGSCPFWGRDLLVSPQVLIPRPETELLVEAALTLSLPETASVLDVGTGSGCIAVTLAAERPGWQVVASDRSLSALAVARANVAGCKVSVRLLRCDLVSALDGEFDLVTANLPYIPTSQIAELQIEVQHDPINALDGGAGGLDLVYRLLEVLPDRLVPGGRVLLELGEDQADQVAARAASKGLAEERRIADLGGCDRILLLRAS
jgi:release factor glutamine methyltransferase